MNSTKALDMLDLKLDLVYLDTGFKGKFEDAEIAESQYSETTTRSAYLRSWLNAPIRDDLTLEIELLALSFSIGLQDATTYPKHLCFASNQTGNTIFLAVGASGIAPSKLFSFANVGFALTLFLLGGFVMGQIGNMVGPRRRIWLLVSNVIQTMMVSGAAVLSYVFPDSGYGPLAWLVISLLAFAAGGQVAMARGVKITEISTAMASSAYVDVLVDPKLWDRHNRSRNRRIAFLIMLTAGGFAGAYSYKYTNSAFALLLSAIIKVAVTVALGFNKRMTEEELEEFSRR